MNRVTIEEDSVTASRASEPSKLNGEVRVGKDVLELLTGAMYVDPLTVFREYIQNATDAIDDAREAHLYREGKSPRIDIWLDSALRAIRVRDNGIGLRSDEFIPRMTAVGGSRKRGRGQRGFRGVGRLSGLGYAQQVVFRSQAPGENRVNEISWDGRRLRELLRDASYRGDLVDAIREVAVVSSREASNLSDHFFEVELRRVARVRNDLLLNPDEVRRYIAQVAPVPFSPSFTFGSEIEAYLAAHGVGQAVTIQLASESAPIYRLYQDEFQLGEKVTDRFSEVELVEIPGIDGGNDAVGWILHHSYFGAIPRAAGISGIRFRAGNIQVGGQNVLESLFSEPRFNSWCVGELHVLSDRILPNGRRDDFELNAHYQNLEGHAAAVAGKLSRLCRERSMQRNRLRQANFLYQEATEQLAVIRDRSTPMVVKEYYRSCVTDAAKRLNRIATDPKFTEEEQSQILKRGHTLLRSLDKSKVKQGGDKVLDFLPKQRRKVFLETLSLVIGACDNPEQAAKLTRRVLDRARRSVH
jgi:molecular chaperone HtpG